MIAPRILVKDVKAPVNDIISPTVFISRGFNSFGSERVPTFLDSGASDNMFMSKGDFVEYKATTLHTRDSAKAIDGNFEIIREGQVVQHYFVEGREKKITYTHALHTPTLNANLISVSTFDTAGLTTFGGGHRIIMKGDGTIVLTARQHKEMYIVDVVDDLPESQRRTASQPQCHLCHNQPPSSSGITA